MNDSRTDRLYELLPAIYRMRDADQGEPLRALLQIVSEQVNLLEDDIAQLYDNWFIETCEDWVVPYLGDLIGYQTVHEAGEPSPGTTLQGQLRNKILIPRREVANTIRYRRRKGSLALLELLSHDIADWPARVVEFYQLLSQTQALNHLRLERGKTVDVRNVSAMALIDSAFDSQAHTVDIRRMNSRYSQGLYNIPSIGLFVWRLKSYPVSLTPAYCLEAEGLHCFTFSVLGNDSPLYMLAKPESDPTDIATEHHLPVAVRRQFLKDNLHHLYGADKCLTILKGKPKKEVPIEQIQIADLSDWQYFPKRGKVAIDPELGRIVFPPGNCPKAGVWVKYHYGFSDDIGGGEYTRPLIQAVEPTLYQVGKGGKYKGIQAALKQWRKDKPEHALIEILDSGVYVEQINIDFDSDHDADEGNFTQLQSLQLRAADKQRPIIRLLDWCTSGSDSLTVNGDCVACFTLEGILLTGRGMQIYGDLVELSIRHTTLVPGWSIAINCDPEHSETSLEILSPRVCVKIEHSILGVIQVNPVVKPLAEEAVYHSDDDSSAIAAQCQGIGSDGRVDPIRLCISDSIVDATATDDEAIGAPGCPVAHACLTILRSTVFGQIHVHAIELAENSLFNGGITVARRQKGCLRFCYVHPDSRTPRRYRCQPDLVIKGAGDELKKLEMLRIQPRFNSVRYGTPTYCQLSDCSADEIKRGADDESEMGVFHNLYQPQRIANLTVRLNEYLPARMDVGIIVSS